jgi:predicted enzyme related to lactoylglutathione lyase
MERCAARAADHLQVIRVTNMLSVNFVLYVSDLKKSAALYSHILQQSPIALDPPFVMFFLESGERLGLLDRATRPTPDASSSGFELAFPVGENSDVDRVFQEWRGLDVTIVDPPHELPFAYNFLAVDPDGHRLRVFCRRVHS